MKKKDQDKTAAEILLEIRDEIHAFFRLVMRLNIGKPMDFPFYTKEEVRQAMNWSERTERRRRRDGFFPSTKRNGQVLYEKKTLFKLLSKKRTKKR